MAAALFHRRSLARQPSVHMRSALPCRIFLHRRVHSCLSGVGDSSTRGSVGGQIRCTSSKTPSSLVGRPLTNTMKRNLEDFARYQTEFGDLPPELRKVRVEILSGRKTALQQLQASISNDDLTSQLISVCLTAQLNRMTIHSRGSHQHTAMLKTEAKGLAHTVLTQIWTDTDLWLPLITTDHSSRFAICYFALAENLDQYLTGWVTVSDDFTNVGPGGPVWKGLLVKTILAAYLVLDIDKADRAIKYFFHVRDLKHSTGIANLHLAPASYRLFVALESGAIGNTDAYLWDKFVRYIEDTETETPLTEKKTPRFYDLYHPARPDVSRVFAFFETKAKDLAEHSNPRFLSELLAWRQTLSVNHGRLSGHLRRASDLLLQKNRRLDAALLERLNRTLLSAAKNDYEDPWATRIGDLRAEAKRHGLKTPWRHVKTSRELLKSRVRYHQS